MGQSNGPLLALLGVGGLVGLALSSRRASASAPPAEQPSSSTPSPALPAEEEWDQPTANEPPASSPPRSTPSAPAPEEPADDFEAIQQAADEPGAQTTLPTAPEVTETLPSADEQRLAVAAALAAHRLESQASAATAKKQAAAVAAAQATAPTRNPSKPSQLVTDMPTAATPNSSAARQQSGFVTAPLPSVTVMPAAKPSTSKPSTSKPAAAKPKTDLAKAKAMAVSVAGNLRTHGRDKYDRPQLAAFQAAAGIGNDGLYGPLAESALRHFGASPPKAFFKGSVTKYTPPK